MLFLFNKVIEIIPSFTQSFKTRMHFFLLHKTKYIFKNTVAKTTLNANYFYCIQSSFPIIASYTRWEVHSHPHFGSDTASGLTDTQLSEGGGLLGKELVKSASQPPPRLPETIHSSILWPSLPLTLLFYSRGFLWMSSANNTLPQILLPFLPAPLSPISWSPFPTFSLSTSFNYFPPLIMKSLSISLSFWSFPHTNTIHLVIP